MNKPGKLTIHIIHKPGQEGLSGKQYHMHSQPPIHYCQFDPEQDTKELEANLVIHNDLPVDLIYQVNPFV
jgi:hypothetical protein